MELKNLGNMKVTIIPTVIGAFGTVTKGLLKGLEDLEVGGRWGDHPNNSIIENGQNTQSPVKGHQVTLMWKTLMSNNNNSYKLQQNWHENQC